MLVNLVSFVADVIVQPLILYHSRAPYEVVDSFVTGHVGDVYLVCFVGVVCNRVIAHDPHADKETHSALLQVPLWHTSPEAFGGLRTPR
jgi:hypothetical protein